MAEYCSTSITFYSENQESLERFFKAVSDSFDACENDAVSSVLKQVCDVLTSSYPCENISKITDGGVIEDISTEIINGSFQVCVSSKYTPEIDIWKSVLEAAVPDVKMVYKADEVDSCSVFINSDVDGNYYPERYYARIIRDGEVEEEDYFETEAEVIAAVNDWLGDDIGSELTTIDEIQNFSQEFEEDGDFGYKNQLVVAKYDIA